jgi:uncharacterized protein (DUF1778 family)
MAKKAKPTPPEPEVESSTSIIKLRLSTKEAKLIRLAAAVSSQQPGVYARAVVLEQARKDVEAAKGDWI